MCVCVCVCVRVRVRACVRASKRCSIKSFGLSSLVRKKSRRVSKKVLKKIRKAPRNSTVFTLSGTFLLVLKNRKQTLFPINFRHYLRHPQNTSGPQNSKELRPALGNTPSSFGRSSNETKAHRARVGRVRRLLHLGVDLARDNTPMTGEPCLRCCAAVPSA